MVTKADRLLESLNIEKKDYDRESSSREDL
jgi:hypothetical protein